MASLALRDLSGVYNVREFGVGRGADAAAAINDAIRQANADGGGVVLLPADLGTVRLAASIGLRSNVHLVIAKGVTLQLQANQLVPVISSYDVTASLVNVAISGGGTINGNRANQSMIPLGLAGVADRGIYLPNVTGFSIEDLIITGCYSDGLFLDTCARGVVRAVRVGDCGRDGIRLGTTTYTTLDACIAFDNSKVSASASGDGFHLTSTSTDNVLIGCVAYDTGAGAAKRQGYGMREEASSSCNRNAVVGGAFQGNATGGVSLIGAASIAFAQSAAMNTLTASGGLSISAGGLTISAGSLTMGDAASEIVPGATSFAIRNTADSANNLLITDAGVATVRAGLTITAGGLTVTAGNLGVGQGPLTAAGIYLGSASTTGSNQYGLLINASFTAPNLAGYGISVQPNYITSGPPDVYGVWVGSPNGTLADVLRTYGVYVQAQSTGGTTSNYGVYVEAPSGASTNNRAIYAAGAGIESAGGGDIIHSRANGQSLQIQSLTELLTIAEAAFSDTTIQIPANAVVLAVSARVTTVIPTAATWDIGVAGATTRYGTGLAVAAETTSPGTLDGTRYYGSAASIRITPNIQPVGATGRVRVTVYFYSSTPPTS